MVMERLFLSLLPLVDYFQTPHSLILPEELAGAVEQNGG